MNHHFDDPTQQEIWATLRALKEAPVARKFHMAFLAAIATLWAWLTATPGALAQLEQIVADAARVLGPAHSDTLLVMENLARVRRDREENT